MFTFLVVTILVSYCGGGNKGPTVEYQLNLEKGKTYKWEIITEQDISQSPMGRTMEMKQKIRMAMDFTVNEADASGYDITITYTGIGYYQKSPMGEVDYDSDNPPRVIPLMAKGFAGLLNEGFDIKLDKMGNVLKVKNVDLLFDRMVKKMELPDAKRTQVMTQLKQQFGDKSLLDSFKGVISIFPDKPVAVGDSWKRTLVMAGATPMVIHNRWKLTKRENGIAYIDVKSSIKPNPDAKPLQVGALTLNYSLRGDQAGEMELDEKTGWTLKAVLDQNVKGAIEMAGNTWPITIRSMIILSSR
jgi:hypothetical protein